MSKFICSLLTISSFFFNPFNNTFTTDYEALYGESLESRYILKTDHKIESLVDIPLRKSWWSRGYEYAWAAQFANKEATVLDAGCGVSHPFKWYLGETCKETWACDLDPRINKKQTIIQETYDDLGEEAYAVLVNNSHLFDQVNIVNASIVSLPESMPQFDRIFCISALDFLTKKDRKKALAELERFLAPEGLVILTLLHPDINPKELLADADAIGLIPAGTVSLNIPENCINTDGYLSHFRCVLKHKE